MRQAITAQEQIAQANIKHLNENKYLSYPPKSRINNALDEASGAKDLTVVFTNPTATDKVIVFTPNFDVKTDGRTIYTDVADQLAKLSATHVFKTVVPVDAAADFGVACTDQDRSIEQFMREIYHDPTRLVGISMDSKQISTGKPDTSNYNKRLRTIFTSSLENPEIRDLNLRPQLDGNTFNANIMQVNFIKNNFPVLLSWRTFLQMVIAKDTELIVTFHVGAQDSQTRRMYDAVKKSDRVVREISAAR